MQIHLPRKLLGHVATAAAALCLTASTEALAQEYPSAGVTAQQPAPQANTEQAQPAQGQPQPQITVEPAKPDVTVQQTGKPEVTVVPPGQGKERQPTADQLPAATTKAETPEKAAQPEQRSDLPTMGRSLIGKTIYGRDGAELAEIDNVVATNNQTQAVLVDVGGFLGFGAKTVAIALTDLELRGDRIVAPKLTEQDLEAMPAYSGIQ